MGRRLPGIGSSAATTMVRRGLQRLAAGAVLLGGAPLQAMPVWELLPPPPLPPLPVSTPPKPSPALAAAPKPAAPKPLSPEPASSPQLARSAGLQWEMLEAPSQLAAGPAAPGLSPITGFPTVASVSGLVWELAPSPAPPSNLLALAPQPVVAQETVPGLIEPPAPVNTASGLRWELVDDPSAVAAEQPDPESLTTPPELRYTPPFLLSPYIGGAVPSAYVAGWGDFYVSASAATPGKLRGGNIDGSFNTGLGFGDADRYVAVEVDWGIGSVKNFNFNGGFSGAIGRTLIRNDNIHLALSGGVIEFYDYGNEADDEPPSPYGSLSLTIPLRPNHPIFQQRLQFTVGGGGAAFAWQDENFEGPDAGFFAAMGMELTRNTGLSAAWSGRGMNANFSYVPFRDIPISINVLAADVFNSSPYGRVGVLTVTWGTNFANGVF